MTTITCEKKPSEIFLRLWQYRTATDEEATADDFVMCADIWAQIREMEAMATKTTTVTFEDFWSNPPGMIKRSTAGQKEPEASSQLTAEPDKEEIGAPAPEDISGDPKPKKKNHQKTTGEGQGVTAWAVRKRAALGALAKARANGVPLASIADASGLTLGDVIGLNNGAKMPAPIWSQLERGLKNLGYPPGGPDAAGAEQPAPTEK